MITGLGNTFIQPNTAVPPPVFPPFPSNAAINGLSVDPVTGEIVWGQDVGDPANPAQLLSNRIIPAFGFDFSMFLNNELDPFPILNFNNDAVNPTGRIGGYAVSGNTGAGMNWQGGDPLGATPLVNLETFTANTVQSLSMVNDETTTVQLTADFDQGLGQQIGLFIDWLNQVYYFGDANGVANGSGLFSDDSFGVLNMAFNAGNLMWVDNAGLYQFGDINNVAASGVLDMQPTGVLLGDNNSVATDLQLRLNFSLIQWGIGNFGTTTNLLLNMPSAGIGLSFFDSNGTNPFLLPDPAFGGIAFISAPDFSTQLALSDAGSGSLAQLGDVGAASTGMTATVDVVNSELIIQDTAMNAAVRINNVLGFTGTVAPPLTITVDGGIVTNVA